MHLRLVPFNPAWPDAVGPSGAPLLDIHAIYRRPHVDQHAHEEEIEAAVIRDAAGFIQWDITGPLPVRHHAKWVARGFEYITLADEPSLRACAKAEIRESGVVPIADPAQYQQNHRTGSPWSWRLYRQDLAEERQAQIDALERDIRDLGAERAESMRRAQDPGYVLPAAFAASVGGAQQAEDEPAARPARRTRKAAARTRKAAA